MKLFDEYPVLEDDNICLRRMTMTDADALGELARCEEVYRFEPTFLYERRYEDPQKVLERMDEECFDTHESLLLGVYVQEKQASGFVGIAEVYGYDEDAGVAFIGGRLHPRHWCKGIARHIVALLRDYLFSLENFTCVRTHVMPQNAGSMALMRSCGFVQDGDPVTEDWGHGPMEVCAFSLARGT